MNAELFKVGYSNYMKLNFSRKTNINPSVTDYNIFVFIVQSWNLRKRVEIFVVVIGDCPSNIVFPVFLTVIGINYSNSGKSYP